MFYYVMLDSNNVVTAVFESSSEMDINLLAEYNIILIQIPEYDVTLLGKQYVNGDFVDPVSTP